MNKIYTYNNNKLTVLVINYYQNNPYIVYEKEICKFRIIDLKKQLNYEEIIQQIKKIDLEINKKFENEPDFDENQTILLYKAQIFKIKEEVIFYDFDEKTMVYETDIQRILKKFKKEYKYPEIYQIADFVKNTIYYDSIPHKKTQTLECQELKIIGDIIFVDKKTITELKELFKVLNIEFNKTYPINYFNYTNIKDNKIKYLLNLNFEQNEIMLNNEHAVNIKSSKTGLYSVLDKIFQNLTKNYEQEIAEKITRGIREKWILKTYPYEYDIMDNIDINEVIKLTRNALIEYIELLIQKSTEKFQITKIHINTQELIEEELLEVLNEKLDYEFEVLYPRHLLISNIISKEEEYCLKQIYKEQNDK